MSFETIHSTSEPESGVYNQELLEPVGYLEAELPCREISPEDPGRIAVISDNIYMADGLAQAIDGDNEALKVLSIGSTLEFDADALVNAGIELVLFAPMQFEEETGVRIVSQSQTRMRTVLFTNPRGLTPVAGRRLIENGLDGLWLDVDGGYEETFYRDFKSVFQGGLAIDPLISRWMCEVDTGSIVDQALSHSAITPQQARILPWLFVEGISNRQISQQIGIGQQTLKTHKNRLQATLREAGMDDVDDLRGAVKIAPLHRLALNDNPTGSIHEKLLTLATDIEADFVSRELSMNDPGRVSLFFTGDKPKPIVDAVARNPLFTLKRQTDSVERFKKSIQEHTIEAAVIVLRDTDSDEYLDLADYLKHQRCRALFVVDLDTVTVEKTQKLVDSAVDGIMIHQPNIAQNLHADLKRIFYGGFVVDPLIARWLTESRYVPVLPEGENGQLQLTNKELEVLVWYFSKLTRKEVAKMLGRSKETLITHRRRLNNALEEAGFSTGSRGITGAIEAIHGVRIAPAQRQFYR